MARPSRFSPEVRQRAVRMVFEHAQDHASQIRNSCALLDAPEKTVYRRMPPWMPLPARLVRESERPK
jgi:transposase-like protein